MGQARIGTGLGRLGRWSRREWRLLAGLALSAVCLALAVRGLSPPALQAALGTARWPWVVWVVLTTIAGTVLKASRWQSLLLPAKVRLSRTWSILLIGQMLNIALPARAGEVGRIYYIDQAEQVGRARALATVVIEKMVDLVMLALGYLLVALWLSTSPGGLPAWLPAAGTALLPPAGLALAGLLLFAYAGRAAWRFAHRLLRPLPKQWQAVVERGAVQIIAGFEALRESRIGARLWGTSLAIWILASLANLLMFRAFGLALPASAALLLLVVLMSGVAVPPLPGNLGVFPYLCQLVLSLFGVDRETGLVYGLALQAAVYLPLVLLGAAGLVRENALLRRQPRRPESGGPAAQDTPD